MREVGREESSSCEELLAPQAEQSTEDDNTDAMTEQAKAAREAAREGLGKKVIKRILVEQ